MSLYPKGYSPCETNYFIPFRVYFYGDILTLYLMGYILYVSTQRGRAYYTIMNKIAEFIKENRRAAGLTQEEFAIRSGLGLRFVRDLEQGKETVRMDKVNAALAMFNSVAVPGRKDER